jgi:hypothetical protein
MLGECTHGFLVVARVGDRSFERERDAESVAGDTLFSDLVGLRDPDNMDLIAYFSLHFFERWVWVIEI